MSVKTTNCAIAIGRLDGGHFLPGGQEGDWMIFSVPFTGRPAPIFDGAPRVLATPVLDDPFDFGAFPVCVVRGVSATGFTLAARNAATRGFAGFNWLAVRETPGVMHDVPNLSLGVLSPRVFGAADSGNHQIESATLVQLDTASAAVLLTATDQDVDGQSVAAIGALRTDCVEGAGHATGLAAYNPDCAGGACGFNWARLPFNEVLNRNCPVRHDAVDAVDAGGAARDRLQPPMPDLHVETGEVPAARFQPAGQSGDWQKWGIHFKDRFAAAPIVLVTGYKPEATPPEANPAVVGVVQDVTPDGFRLAARNSDVGSGDTGFYWIALGSSPRF